MGGNAYPAARILYAALAAAVASGQVHPVAPKTTSVAPASHGTAPKPAVVPCAKPFAWNALRIPEMRSAAEYGWSWVNASNQPPEAIASRMQRDMQQLNKSVQAASGKYSDAAIQTDMKSYMNGVNQLAGCPGFGPGAEQVAQLPILSIRRLTHTINVIHSMHQQARNPVNVHGMASFQQAEKAASMKSAGVTTTAENASSKIEAALSKDPQSRADDLLSRLIEAGAKAASEQTSPTEHDSSTPVVHVTVTATSRTPSAAPPNPTAVALRNQTQTFQMGGLTHPVRPAVVKTYTPPNPQTASQMNDWLRRDLSAAPRGVDQISVRDDSGDMKFAFADASEEPEIRPDSMLADMQTSGMLSIPIDAKGLALRWEDLTRYTDYRDIQYTAVPSPCDSCDALLQRGYRGKIQ